MKNTQVFNRFGLMSLFAMFTMAAMSWVSCQKEAETQRSPESVQEEQSVVDRDCITLGDWDCFLTLCSTPNGLSGQYYCNGELENFEVVFELNDETGEPNFEIIPVASEKEEKEDVKKDFVSNKEEILAALYKLFESNPEFFK